MKILNFFLSFCIIFNIFLFNTAVHMSNNLYYEQVPFCFCPWEMSDESTHRNSIQTEFAKIYTKSFEHTSVYLVNSEVVGEKPT